MSMQLCDPLALSNVCPWAGILWKGLLDEGVFVGQLAFGAHVQTEALTQDKRNQKTLAVKVQAAQFGRECSWRAFIQLLYAGIPGSLLSCSLRSLEG